MTKTCGNCGNPCGRENCGFWEPNNEVLEQRYQQLAELAREMIAEYQDCAHALSLCRGRNYIREYYTLPGDFRKRLEELGVEL